jgi:lipopolysaccharide biosynthesis regulator YciM
VSRVVTVIILLVAIAFSYFSIYNQNMVEVTVWGGQSTEMPLIGVVLVSMALGAAIVLLLFTLRGFRNKYYQLQENMKKRRRGRAEELYNRGVDAHLSGKRTQAIRLLEEAVGKDSDFLLPFFRLGTVYMEQGKVDLAIDLHLKAREAHPGNLRVKLLLVDDYLAANRLEDASQVLRDIIARDDANRTALMMLRDIQEQQGDWEGAAETQRRLIKVTSDKASARAYLLGLKYECAAYLLENNNADKASRILKEVLKESPDFLAATVSLGEAVMAQGKLDEGIKVLADGYRKHNNPVFLQAMEDQLLKAENPRKLIETFRSLLDSSPGDVFLNLFYGKSCLKLEMVDDGYMALKKVESMGYDTPLLHSLLGEANARRERFAEAIDEFRLYNETGGGDSPLFVCDNCGNTEGYWSSRCDSCGEWNSFSLPGLIEPSVQPAARPQYESE